MEEFFIENWVRMREFNKADQPLKGAFRIGREEDCAKWSRSYNVILDRTIEVL